MCPHAPGYVRAVSALLLDMTAVKPYPFHTVVKVSILVIFVVAELGRVAAAASGAAAAAGVTSGVSPETVFTVGIAVAIVYAGHDGSPSCCHGGTSGQDGLLVTGATTKRGEPEMFLKFIV